MNRKLEVLLIAPDADVAGQFRVLSQHEQVHFHHFTDLPSARAAVDGKPDMAFVDISQLIRSGIVDELQIGRFNGVALFAVGAAVEADTVRMLMKAGVQDVLSLPPSEHELLKELEGVMEKRNQESLENAGKLVVFSDAKGGSGGTTLAVNVAWSLADSGALSVLLVDLDIQFGDVALALDVKPSSGVMEALAQSRRLDNTLLASLTVTMENGLQVLAAPPAPASLDAVRLDDLRRLLEVAVTSYDIVIVDVPRVLTDWTREVWRWSDHVFLAMQGCVSEIRDGRLLMDEFSRLAIDKSHIHLVHNRKGARGEAGGTEVMEKAFDVGSIHEIRNDYAVAIKAHDSGKPVIAMAAGSGLAGDLRKLAEAVAGFCNKSLPRRAGVLGRLFGNKSTH
jgi:pilus assembly protein CpaE